MPTKIDITNNYETETIDELRETTVGQAPRSANDHPHSSLDMRREPQDWWLQTRCACRTCEWPDCNSTAVVINFHVAALCPAHAVNLIDDFAPLVAWLDRRHLSDAEEPAQDVDPCWHCGSRPVTHFLAERADPALEEVLDASCEECLVSRAKVARSLDWALAGWYLHLCADTASWAEVRAKAAGVGSGMDGLCRLEHPPTRYTNPEVGTREGGEATTAA